MPISHEKTHEPTTVLTFLGIELDTKKRILRIPQEKRFKALTQLDHIISSKKVTVLEIQQLTGLLNFLGRAIFPGRAFTRRMYSKHSDTKLKQHYHVYVDREFRLDCQTWMKFLTMNDAVNRPFVDFSLEVTADELNWYCDSTANARLGFGCYYDGRYAYATWDMSEPGLIERYNPSINFLELYAIVVSVELWGHLISNRRVVIFSDNESAVHMVNNSSSSCQFCMKLIRNLTLTSLRFNTRVFLKHIPGKYNILSDSLSRGNLKRFFKHVPRTTLKKQAEILPAAVWPIRNEWLAV